MVVLSKNTQISNVTKIRPVGDELLNADEQTYKTKLKVALCHFSNTSESE